MYRTFVNCITLLLIDIKKKTRKKMFKKLLIFKNYKNYKFQIDKGKYL